ncbi:MAG: hypothetical protein AAF772_13495 [Acidobacteriota bacterium]
MHRFARMFLASAALAAVAVAPAIAEADKAPSSKLQELLQRPDFAIVADPAFFDELEDPYFRELLRLRDAEGPVALVRVINTTQGPLWPPANAADENGDFILANGVVLRQAPDGQVFPAIGSVIVSKDTVPPLDSEGREDFRNAFGSHYTIVRELDLSPGSADLDLVIHTQSYGPPEGDFGGGPRVPMEGRSQYNLNSFPLAGGFPCPEVFPAASQRFTYTRESYPIHRNPPIGFQGDGVAYDIDTGAEYVPTTAVGPDCPPAGCDGEDELDFFRDEPITLGEWLETKAWVRIELTDWNAQVQAYTAAKFTVLAKDLVPSRVFQIMAVRRNVLVPSPIYKRPDPVMLPQILVSDADGRGRWSGKAPNPFPDPAEDPGNSRVLGTSLGLRADHMTWAGCTMRFAPGVDSMAAGTTFAHSFENLMPSNVPFLITKPAP